uniref:RING-type E3 ubiquitin transferase n=1 Tax=Anolis carolinensis TaxID=28377 RepID=L7MZQ7_ANOCA
MAAAPQDPFQKLCEEATCSICLDYFDKPVTTECGHNFCQGCLDQYCGDSETEVSCPQCRENVQRGSLRHNRLLANFVDITKQLENQGAKVDESEGQVCEKHQEPQKLFCKEDQTPICMVCDKSKEHRDHNVVPVEEAAEEYKDWIYNCLEDLRKEKEMILRHQADTEDRQYLTQDFMKAEEQSTVATFGELQQFLKEQEKFFLAEIEDVMKEFETIGDAHLSRILEERSYVEGFIQELEEQQQLPAIEFLQGVQRIMQRIEGRKTCKNLKFSFPLALKWKSWAVCSTNNFLMGLITDFKDAVLSGQQEQQANITLDPNTAHPQLVLSEDLKSVTWMENCQDLPDNPERFDKYPIVMAREGFTAGRHFWDVIVGSEEEWAVGVASKHVDRKGFFVLLPDRRFWALGKWGGQYMALTSPCNSVLNIKHEPQKIRVHLNYAAGFIVFFNADTGHDLFEFSGLTFAGETLLPFFRVHGKAHLIVSP